MVAVPPIGPNPRSQVSTTQNWQSPRPVEPPDRPSPLVSAHGYPTELAEQFAVVAWCKRLSRTVEPALDLLFAVPNGAKRDHQEATIKLMEGMRKGVPDLWIPAPRKGFHGLVIEMKVAVWPGAHAPKPVVSTEQHSYLDALRKEGYFAVVCCGADVAKQTIREYFGFEGDPV